jgi:hypothetical protein
VKILPSLIVVIPVSSGFPREVSRRDERAHCRAIGRYVFTINDIFDFGYQIRERDGKEMKGPILC